MEELVQSYISAVKAHDYLQMMQAFHSQFQLSTPERIWHFLENNDLFKTNIDKSFKRYATIGAMYCSSTQYEIVTMPSTDHALANVEWSLYDSNDQPMLSFDITYCMKQIEGQWKFIFVIDHNEDQRIKNYLE